MTRSLALSLLLGLAACGPQSHPDDGASASALSGFTDGTPAAAGILQVANTVSLADLEDKTKVGITKQAAKQIVASRPLATLKALDAVPYVGKTTMNELYAYAVKQGWTTPAPTPPSSTDPFDANHCTGTEMTNAQALAHFGAAESLARLGDVQHVTRKRNCNDVTGCAAWGPSMAAATGQLTLSTEVDGGVASYNVSVYYDHANSSCGKIALVQCPPMPFDTEVNSSASVQAAILTNSCFRLDTMETIRQPYDTSGDYVEYETVVYLDGIKPTCAPTTCADIGDNCGTIDDGCGGTLNCGTCSGLDTCGGAGTPNVCGHYVSPCGYACTNGQICCANGQGGYDCFDECGGY